MTNSDKSYLVYMAVRLLEMRRILKPTGSIYLHCDPTMSHYLKLIMDAVFGRKNFEMRLCGIIGDGLGKQKDFNDFMTYSYFTRGGGASEEEHTFNILYTDYTEGSKDRKKQGVLHRFKRGYDPVLVSTGTVDKKGVAENDVWLIPLPHPQKNGSGIRLKSHLLYLNG